ncbi:MAG TPA: hypothetical protein VK162_20200 [Streptosporangiaceae bacterium]|nr:hypothetical protein [Streptosporangiaceae bacterium]
MRRHNRFWVRKTDVSRYRRGPCAAGSSTRRMSEHGAARPRERARLLTAPPR